MKCVYWLNDARSRGLKPEEVIVAAQALNQSAGQPRALLVGRALLHDVDIAGKLGCLTSENLDRLRHGRSPVISRGPYAGEPGRSYRPARGGAGFGPGDRQLGIAAPHPEPSQRRTMGARQLDYLEKFRKADLLNLRLTIPSRSFPDLKAKS